MVGKRGRFAAEVFLEGNGSLSRFLAASVALVCLAAGVLCEDCRPLPSSVEPYLRHKREEITKNDAFILSLLNFFLSWVYPLSSLHVEGQTFTHRPLLFFI